MSTTVRVAACLAAISLSGATHAQFNNTWVEFQRQPERLRDSNGVPAPGYIAADPQEKDFAWGDLDQDGWIDLVVMRKQPVTTTGAFPNYLLMNEGGLLVDRSAQYASQADVPGDNGFLTPTNDRDAVIVDVNLDGWLDVVTCTAMSDGQPKHISHPRVYVNLGDDANGNWLGLRFEDFRMPAMSPTPRFCGVGAGDVTGDGAPDLYFADYGSLEDKLLVNDGTGTFNDSGTTRMTASMLNTSFGTSVQILDMNGDGALDVVRGQSGGVSVAYNNPANVGFFPSALFQTNLGVGAPYHAGVGDLNNDARPDVIMSDDGSDNYRYNTGVDGLGRVVWGPGVFYQFLTGGDDSFAGNNIAVDLDNDGWNDTVYSDVDVDIAGCGRRSKIYHNPGGAIGAQIVLREEAEAPSGGWRGVKGMLASDLTGTYDVAVFDLDNDGDLDMVYGRCSGTFVWINQLSSCPTDHYTYGEAIANSTGQPASISSNGDGSIASNSLVLSASAMPPLKTGLFLYGTQRLWAPAPFGNGNRWIGGTIQRLPVQQTDANGAASLAADFTVFPLNTLSPGSVRDFQFWYRDPAAGGALYNVSNALELVVCP